MRENMKLNSEELKDCGFEVQSPREEIKESLYEKIDHKIEVILDMRKFAEENENSPAEELKEKINNKLERSLNGLLRTGAIIKDQIITSEEQSGLFNERQRLQQLVMEKEELLSEGDCAEKFLEINKIYLEINQISEQIKTLGDNLDLQFLRRLSNFAEDMTYKRALVEKYEEKYKLFPESLFAVIEKNYNFDFKGIDKSKIKVSFNGYSIVLEISEQDFNNIDFKNIKGKEVNGFCYNFFIFLKDKEGKEDTLRHEKNHNLSSSFAEAPVYQEKFIKYLQFNITKIEKWKENGDNERAAAYKKQLDNEIKNYVYKNFNEIIADVENIEAGRIRTFLSNFLEVVGSFDEICNETDDSEIKTLLREAEASMRDKFVKYMDLLSNIFFVAGSMGESEQAKGALILFKPEQMEKIEKYFKHRYGQEKYDIYTKLKPLICGGNYFKGFNRLQEYYKEEGLAEQKRGGANSAIAKKGELIKDLFGNDGLESFYQLDNLKKLTRMLDAHPIVLQEKDKEKIARTLRVKDIGYKVNLEELMELDGYFKKLADKLSIPELRSFIEYRAASYFIYFNLLNGIGHKNFQDFEESYKKWSFDKDLFRSSILNHSTDIMGRLTDSETIEKFLACLKNIGVDVKDFNNRLRWM
ncbi:MAG: hypothetical protein V1860_04185 [bacterium]